jgi:hypothetical protein
MQTAFVSGSASYSEVEVTGPSPVEPVDPVVSHAEVSYTANWTDTTGRVFPREGRFESLTRDDSASLVVWVETVGGELSNNQPQWGPVVESAMQSFSAPA